jgi:Subtilase family
MHVRQAIHKAGMLTPTLVAVLSTGVSAVGGLTLRKGKTFVGGDPERDVFGHGTQVSSLIAAIAPTAEIIPVKVMNDDGTATSFEIIQGLEYAISTGARIMVLPFGTSEPSQIQEKLIAEAKTKGFYLPSRITHVNHPRSLCLMRIFQCLAVPRKPFKLLETLEIRVLKRLASAVQLLAQVMLNGHEYVDCQAQKAGAPPMTSRNSEARTWCGRSEPRAATSLYTKVYEP